MKIDNKYVVPGILLILGALTIAAVIFSWNVYPDWWNDPAGLVGLVVIAFAGTLVIVKGLFDLIKSVLEVWRLLPKEPKTPDSIKTPYSDYFFECYCAAPGKPELQRADFNQALWCYLDWLKKDSGVARLYTDKPPKGEHIPVRKLEDVFIPLRLRLNTQPEPDEIQGKILPDDQDGMSEHRAYLTIMEHRKKEGEGIPMEQLLTISNRLAIIGGAGSGKSTLAAYLAFSLAEAALTGRNLPYQLPSGLPILLPIIVPLRSYRYYQREYKVRDLHSFIIEYVNQRSITLHLQESFFERLLQSSACMLILDGLDEVVSKSDRAIVKERIEQLARSVYPNAFFMITAREAGYQEHAIFGDDFKRLDVQDLESGEIDLLVNKWCRLIPKLENRSKEITSKINEINDRYITQGLPALLDSPLLVTMVVSASWAEEAELPRERAKLYELVVKAILSSQYTEYGKGEKEEVINYGGPWLHQPQWLSELAWEMHQGGQAAAAISEVRLREILVGTVPVDTLEQFIEAVRYRGSLLEERDELFQFVHLTFQEFLAARYLFQQKDSILNDLSIRLLDSWWREVLLLVYGYAQIDDLKFAERYLKWLSSQPGNSSERLAGLELAGAALLEIAEPQAIIRQQQAGLLLSAWADPNLHAPGILRARAGNTLAYLGDPRFDLETWHLPAEPLLGFMEISAGPFLMGSQKEDDPDAFDDELDRHTLELPVYYLARYPVTVAQYAAFVTDSGYETRDEDSLRGISNHPVTLVTWHDALAYCRWLDGKMKAASAEQSAKAHTATQKAFWQGLADGKLQVTLPSEAEWEKAARGVDGRIYPWQGEFDPQKANMAETGLGSTSTVGCFPAGASPYGLQDMSGNVWEWTRSQYKDYPYQPNDGREDLSVEAQRVQRGGSFISDRRFARCACRDWGNPDYGFNYIGFRVVVSPSDSGL